MAHTIICALCDTIIKEGKPGPRIAGICEECKTAIFTAEPAVPPETKHNRKRSLSTAGVTRSD